MLEYDAGNCILIADSISIYACWDETWLIVKSSWLLPVMKWIMVDSSWHSCSVRGTLFWRIANALKLCLGPRTSDLGPRTSNLGPRTSNLGPRTSNLGPRTSDLGPRTSDLGPRTSDLGPRTSDLEPRTSDLGPRTLNLEPRTSGRARCQVRSGKFSANQPDTLQKINSYLVRLVSR